MSDDFPNRVVEARSARGWSQAQLADAAGTTQSTVDRIEKGVTRWSEAMPGIAAALGIALTLKPKRGGEHMRVPVVPDVLPSTLEVPVFAAAEGGDSLFIIEKEPIDYVPPPDPIAGVQGGYLVYVVGDSMYPAFRPGERAIVHPRLPPVPDEACVFYTRNAADDRACIKLLTKITATEWHVEQFNPPKRYTLNRQEWPKCHRVVGKYSRS